MSDLLEIHSKVGGQDQGKRANQLQVLNKSAVIFCAAIWEAYIEDVVEEAVVHVGKHIKDYKKLPPRLKALIEQQNSDLIKKDASKVWGILLKTLDDLVRDQAKRAANTVPATGKEFNTAKTKPVSDLVESCIGLPDIGSKWKWANMSSKTAQEKLDEFIRLRGDLAHGTPPKDGVTKPTAEAMLNHIERLVKKSDAAIDSHLKKYTGVGL